MTFATAPASIDNTGQSDVTVALSEWLTTQPAARLRRQSDGTPGRYRVDAGLFVPAGCVLDLDGCAVFHEPGTGSEVACPEGPWKTLDRLWPRTRAVVHLGAGATLCSRRAGARINGGNRVPSFLGRWAIGCAYDPRYEAQHAVRVTGDGCTVDLRRIELAWTWGDGVYVEWWVNGTEVFGYRNRLAAYEERGGRVIETHDGPAWQVRSLAVAGIHHIGRQGIAQSGGRDLHVHDLTIWQVHRSLFDFEPGAEGTMSGVLLERVVSGAFQGAWIAARGNGWVNNVTATECLNVHKPLSVICTEWRPEAARREGWAIVDNRAEPKAFFGSPIPCMRFERVDGVTVRANVQPIESRQAGRGLYLDDCTDVDAGDADQFPFTR